MVPVSGLMIMAALPSEAPQVAIKLPSGDQCGHSLVVTCCTWVPSGFTVTTAKSSVVELSERLNTIWPSGPGTFAWAGPLTRRDPA